MTLDEIEVKANKAVGRMDNEIALLIRAVKQLGKGRRYKHGRLDGDTWVPYDPDILGLLEEA